jgi:hypothetical protein
MEFLRAIRKTRRELETYRRGELKMEEIQNPIKGNRLRWFGRVKGIDKDRISERLLEMEINVKGLYIDHTHSG